MCRVGVGDIVAREEERRVLVAGGIEVVGNRVQPLVAAALGQHGEVSATNELTIFSMRPCLTQKYKLMAHSLNFIDEFSYIEVIFNSVIICYVRPFSQ